MEKRGESEKWMEEKLSLLFAAFFQSGSSFICWESELKRCPRNGKMKTETQHHQQQHRVTDPSLVKERRKKVFFLSSSPAWACVCEEFSLSCSTNDEKEREEVEKAHAKGCLTLSTFQSCLSPCLNCRREQQQGAFQSLLLVGVRHARIEDITHTHQQQQAKKGREGENKVRKIQEMFDGWSWEEEWKKNGWWRRVWGSSLRPTLPSTLEDPWPLSLSTNIIKRKNERRRFFVC